MDGIDRWNMWGARAWPYVLVAIAVAWLCWTMAPIERMASHQGRMWLAGFVAGLVVLRWAASRAQPAALLGVRLVAVGALVFGVFNYFQFDRRFVTEVVDHSDPSYYYINSKYLPELGYFGLYAAMIHADRQEGGRYTGHIRQFRDLRDYELKPVSVALTQGAALEREAFTPERWAAFRHDATFFMARLSPGLLKNDYFVDHGYNPPPTWAVVGGTLANLAPVERLTWIAHADTALVGLTFVVLGVAFGPEAALWAALFFVVTFSGRWPILGHALMRFDWVCALVMGFAALHRRHHALGGALLAYAAWNRIFPAIFFMGPGVVYALEAWRARRLTPGLRGLALGAGAMSALLVGAALALYGLDIFAQSAKNLAMHNASYSSHRVGLGDLLLFRGETTKDEIRAFGGIAAKELQIQAMQPYLRAAGLLAIGACAAFLWRVRRDPWDALPLGVLPLFCITNAQINYYNLRLVLVVWHAVRLARPDHPRRALHAAGLAGLFLIEAATQAAMVARYERYAVTATTSIGLGVYLAVVLLWMGWRAARAR